MARRVFGFDEFLEALRSRFSWEFRPFDRGEKDKGFAIDGKGKRYKVEVQEYTRVFDGVEQVLVSFVANPEWYPGAPMATLYFDRDRDIDDCVAQVAGASKCYLSILDFGEFGEDVPPYGD